MSGTVVDCAHGAPPSIDADVCVIGSGAAGAILAHEIAVQGARVVVIERGPHLTARDFNQVEGQMVRALWKNAGVQFAANFTVNVAQGACVGGSTVINDAVCVRTPRDVLRWWEREHGLPWATPEHMQEHFNVLWERLSVRPVREAKVNPNNRKLKEGAEALGWRGSIHERNSRWCKECGFCHLGCHYDTKQSMLVTYVPWGVEKGVAVYANCSASRFFAGESRVGWLECVVMRSGRETTKTIPVTARAFVVCAGAIASSELLLRSRGSGRRRKRRMGLGNENVGHSIGFHPSPAVLARYEEPVNAFAGIPMSYRVEEFESKGDERGFLIEGVYAQPGQLSLVLPSFYPDFMRDFAHYAMAGILLHDEQTGVIRLNPDGRAVFFYELTPRDGRKLREGMRNAAELYLATNPDFVITSHRRQTIIRDKSELRSIDERSTGPAELTLGSAHPQGGNRMGDDRGVYAVNPEFQPYTPTGDVYENLYVCDASVFPTTVGVNPQITVMALALEAARRIRWSGRG